MPFLLYTQVQNLFQQSNNLSIGSHQLVGTTFVGSQANDYNGRPRAGKLVEDTSSGWHRWNQPVDGEDSTWYILEGRFNGDELNKVQFLIWDAANSTTINNTTFNVSSGVYVSGGSDVNNSYWIEDLGDDWYTIGIIGISSLSIGSIQGYISMINSDGVAQYQGGGSDGMYIADVHLYKGQTRLPYVETFSDAVTGESNFVTVEPEYNFKDSGYKVETRHRTRAGKEYTYKWGDVGQLKMEVKYVNSSFKAIVNSWYGDNTDLLWAEKGAGGGIGGADITSLHITNKSKPISGFMKPYDDLFKGIIELGTY